MSELVTAYRRLRVGWRIGLHLALISVLLLTVHLLRPTQSGLWYRTFFDFMHVPVFGIIAVTLLNASREFTGWSLRRRVLVVVLIVFAVSLASEGAQIPGPRDASVDDLVADWVGAASFLLLAIAFSGNPELGRRLRLGFGISGAGVLAFAAVDLALVSAAYVERNRHFPVVTSFGWSFGDRFWRLQNARIEPAGDATPGETWVRVRLEDGTWPGITFHDVYPDWSAYETLVIRIRTADERPFDVIVRVHDREHLRAHQVYSDRFNLETTLTPGQTEIRIPIEAIRNAPRTRQMDLTRIEGIVVFCTPDKAERAFHLGDIRLE